MSEVRALAGEPYKRKAAFLGGFFFYMAFFRRTYREAMGSDRAMRSMVRESREAPKERNGRALQASNLVLQSPQQQINPYARSFRRPHERPISFDNYGQI